MLYFSSEVKMEGPKKSGGQNNFRAGINAAALTFSVLPDLPRLWDCDINVLVWQNAF